MGDHIAAAQRYRARAAKCELSAKNTSSEKFGECYRLLARQYLVLASMEEDCAQLVSPFARHEGKQEGKQESKQDSKQENKQENRPAHKQTQLEHSQVRSVAARMFAVRQLQIATPSTETASMPPMIAIPAAEFGR